MAVDYVPLSDWLSERRLMSDLVHQHLLRAKARMKRQTDKNRSEQVFQEGDWVFLKAQPYVQSSLAARANQKLAFKFFGPYKVISRIGSVAYKLQLPGASLVHPVFHVSQLKKMVGDHHQVTEALPDILFQWSILEAILQRRSVMHGVRPVSQLLIKWSNVPASLATWEDATAPRQQFPNAVVWGQPARQEGGSVSPGTEDGSVSIGVGPRRSTRPKKVNTRVSGPEWL